jgi:hypothetical protein
MVRLCPHDLKTRARPKTYFKSEGSLNLVPAFPAELPTPSLGVRIQHDGDVVRP